MLVNMIFISAADYVGLTGLHKMCLIKCLVRKYLILRYDLNYFPWVVVMVVFPPLEISFSGIKSEFLLYKPTPDLLYEIC
ncbi:hypothetical protein LDENG_00275400 [Lucifuga dentata]|nr:hypothetical protein LDENG_00275400 [Lucifuga dentata]